MEGREDKTLKTQERQIRRGGGGVKDQGLESIFLDIMHSGGNRLVWLEMHDSDDEKEEDSSDIHLTSKHLK